MKRRGFLAAAISLAVLIGGGVAPAHTGWSISGSVKVTGVGLGQSPTFTAFAPFGSTCTEALAIADGLEVSIVRLPAELNGSVHRGAFEWKATVGPAFTVFIQWVGISGTLPCTPLPGGQTRSFGTAGMGPLGEGTGKTNVSIPGNARWIAVTGEPGLDVRWTLTGVDD